MTKMRITIIFVFLAIGKAREFVPEMHKNWNSLPHDICGQVDSQRIIGGVEAPMNAYPWIARIGYTTSNGTSFRCGGIIASSNIVVTAAHCVTDLPEGYVVGVIRLGEHNTETNPDCEGDHCADPVLDIPPSEILIPKDYSNVSLKHDIAIIRLRTVIRFSAFVRPICFASGNLHRKNLVGSIAEVAGWGIYNTDTSETSVKLQVVKLPVINNVDCTRYLPTHVSIGPTQLCVGGIVGKDSCGGDSGGPLMKVDDGPNGPRYYFIGIVSFGSKKCGKTNMPGIYTKMSEYMEWFLNNIQTQSSDSLRVL